MNNGILFQMPLEVNNPCLTFDDSEDNDFNKVLLHC